MHSRHPILRENRLKIPEIQKSEALCFIRPAEVMQILDLLTFRVSVARFVVRVKSINRVALLPMFWRMIKRSNDILIWLIFFCSSVSLELITCYCLYYNILELKYTISLDFINSNKIRF